MAMTHHRASSGAASKKTPDVAEQPKGDESDAASSQAVELQADEAVDADNTQRRSLLTLEAIRDLLDRQHRSTKQHDFSLLRLFGALLQMFAIVAGLWGVASILDDEHAAATARLALASFLQLASISVFAIDRFR